MKLLFISVLIVTMIGVIVPHVFAESVMSEFKLKTDDLYLYGPDMADIWTLKNETERETSIEGALKIVTQEFIGDGQLDQIKLRVEYIEFENDNFAKERYRATIGGNSEEFAECWSSEDLGKWVEKINCRIGNFTVNLASDFNAQRSVNFSAHHVSSILIDTRYDMFAATTETTIAETHTTIEDANNYWWSSCSEIQPELDSLSRPILPYAFEIALLKNIEYLSLTDNSLISGIVMPKNSLGDTRECVELNLFLREYASTCGPIDSTVGLSPSNSAPLCGSGAGQIIWTDYYLKSTTVENDLSFSFVIEPSEMKKWKNHPKIQFIISPANSVTHNNDYGSEPITIRFGEFSIPSWVKNNAAWWAEGTLTDFSFIQTIQYLIDKGIIVISEMGSVPSTEKTIPSWVKNNAGWWAEGQIDDNSFVKGIEYLVKVGIIEVN